MSLPCPGCSSADLAEFEAQPGTSVRLCGSCKGMLLDQAALERLAGPCDLEALQDPGETGGARGPLAPCPRCGSAWQLRSLAQDGPAGIAVCRGCGAIWLAAGELGRLQRHLRAPRRITPPRDPPRSEESFGLDLIPIAQQTIAQQTIAQQTIAQETVAQDAVATAPTPFSPERMAQARDNVARISFDQGIGNLIGVPLLLVVAFVFCSGEVGRFLAALVGMPFHELGHAVASWLSSRPALPLPFFTLWFEQRSVMFGLFVASVLLWLAFHSWREKRHFGLALAVVLLGCQLVTSWLVPARHTLMLQILSGALGEIVLAGLLLVAFHFPLPDRLRWDFWRWPALVPAAICFVQALLLWSRAFGDVSQMPWGSAVGSESDGDMNRLVNQFGWRARQLAAFYLASAWLGLAAIAVAYGIAWRRFRRARITAQDRTS